MTNQTIEQRGLTRRSMFTAAGITALAASVADLQVNALAASASTNYDPGTFGAANEEAVQTKWMSSSEVPWGSFATEHGGPPADWCAYWLSWILRDTGRHTFRTSSTAIYDDYAAMGRIGTVPVPGAIIIYSSDGARTGIEHVGWVQSADSGTAQTIEGNAGSPSQVRYYSTPWSSGSLVAWKYAYPLYTDKETADIVPLDFTKVYAADQALTANAWKTLAYDSAGAGSIAPGSNQVNAVATLQVTGLAAGSEVQVRFVKWNTSTSTYSSVSTTEIVGTSGTTFGQASVNVTLASNELLRFQVMALGSGQIVTQYAVRALGWG